MLSSVARWQLNESNLPRPRLLSLCVQISSSRQPTTGGLSRTLTFLRSYHMADELNATNQIFYHANYAANPIFTIDNSMAGELSSTSPISTILIFCFFLDPLTTLQFMYLFW